METSVTLKSLDQYLLTESDYLPCFSDVYHTVGTVPVGITLIDINSGEVVRSPLVNPVGKILLKFFCLLYDS